jgi:hypothetical protein
MLEYRYIICDARPTCDSAGFAHIEETLCQLQINPRWHRLSGVAQSCS